MNKKALLSLLAASAVAISTPVLAQNYGNNYGYGNNHGNGYGNNHGGGYGYGDGFGREFNQRQERLEQRVERMAYNGRINRNEHRVFLRQFEHLDRLQHAYRRDGFNRRERAELTAQLDRIQVQVRYARQDDRGGGRWDRYDD